MSGEPIVQAEVLSGIDELELHRRAGELDLSFDLADPLVHPLLWSLVFAQWPELLPGAGMDDLSRFYNRYFWFVRFIAQWQSAHGTDAGLEQQSFKLLEAAPDDVDWDLVEQLDERARSGE